VTRQEEPPTSDLRDGPSRVRDLPRAYARADRTSTRARPTIFEKLHAALIAPVYPNNSFTFWGTAKSGFDQHSPDDLMRAPKAEASVRVKS
jgi:hypothetical protein